MKSLVLILLCSLLLCFTIVSADVIPSGMSYEERSRISEKRQTSKEWKATFCKIKFGTPNIMPGSGPVFCENPNPIITLMLFIIIFGGSIGGFLYYRRPKELV